jgi:hypothetical protein
MPTTFKARRMCISWVANQYDTDDVRFSCENQMIL